MVKKNEDGSVERYKMCLVANEMKQVKKADHSQIFSPVVKANSVCIILTVKLKHLDISNAFLNDRLEERIVVSQPFDVTDERKPNHVWLLKCSLYGLKQSSRI